MWRGDRATPRVWARAIIAGGLMFGISYGLLAWAEQRIASGMAALLVATLPFWLTVFEWRKKKPSPTATAGLVLGAVGVAVLVGGDLRVGAAVAPMAAILAGEAAWAAGSLYGRPPRLPGSLALRAGMPMVSGGVLLLAASWAIREPAGFTLASVSPASAAALVYLIVFASIVAFSAYAWLLNVAPISRVGTHAYVNPVIAVAVGSGVAGEPLTASIVVGAAVIAVGVAVVLVSPAAS
jgi:drug/metabolite transporter (DMT)-like permease